MAKSRTIEVKGNAIAVINANDWDFISLADMVKGFGDDTLVYSRMRNHNTVEFLGICEELNNPNFKGDEFVTFKMQAGLKQFQPYTAKMVANTAIAECAMVRDVSLENCRAMAKRNPAKKVQLKSLTFHPMSKILDKTLKVNGIIKKILHLKLLVSGENIDFATLVG